MSSKLGALANHVRVEDIRISSQFDEGSGFTLYGVTLTTDVVISFWEYTMSDAIDAAFEYVFWEKD